MSKNKTLFDFFTSPTNKGSPNLSKKTETPKSSPKCTKDSREKRKKSLNGNFNQSTRTPNGSDFDSPSSVKKKAKLEASSASSKRKRIVIASDSDDSADEYKPQADEKDSSECDLVPSSDSEGNVSSRKKKKPKKLPTTKKSQKNDFMELADKWKNSATETLSTSVSSALASFSATPEKPPPEASSTADNKEWAHTTLEWLKDGKIRDKNGRPQSHPDYDPTTLHVPESFKKSTTPAMKQWWDMKTNHFDTVLFFKVGKFYELYHMDAVIGVNELGLVYMKGDFAHSGFPEIAYGRYSDALVQRGYKVARVEQTETPQMMEERCKTLSKPTKYDKVVAREICQVTTKGTRTFNCQDGVPMATASNYLLSVTEKELSYGECEYGVCFIDTSVGKFYVGQFSDDRYCSRLRTLMSHYTPSEVLYEKDAVTNKTHQVFKSCLGNVRKDAVNSQFWDSSKILKFLIDKNYFSSEGEDNESEFPEALSKMLSEDDRLQQTPKKEFELAIKAFGACIWYLKSCLIEDQLLTMKEFEQYIPVDENKHRDVRSTYKQKHMIIDGIALRNLEILENNSTEVEGTLLETMDFCSTNFGKRLFRQWMCTPLCNPEGIEDRLNAVEDLEKMSHVVDEVLLLLKKLPDLERLLSRIHAQGLCRSKEHPDSRAFLYEEEIYNKRKITSFLSTLSGFKSSLEIIQQFEPLTSEFRSSVLKNCVLTPDKGGCFPDLKEALEYFDTAFNHEKAKKDGCIIPSKGIDHEYDEARRQLKETQKELDEYLEEQKSHFRCQVTYFGTGRNRFQLEVPEFATKYANDDYEFQSQKKGFKRFWTAEIKDMLSRYTAAEETRDAALLDIMRRIFAQFDKDHKLWKTAVDCLSVLDILISFMIYKKSSSVDMCRPEVVLPDNDKTVFLDVVEGRHPSLLKYMSGDYIPNSVYLGPRKSEDNEEDGRVVIVTGPNMGGKSTLMRQTALLVIMAQMGSYVPAEKCHFTVVDRIFTRLGASDKISSGESTFFVEVSETACILKHATSDSLIIIDELGRGTSTYDGTAIACGVVKDIATRLDCRTLFSTHYHNLVEDFISFPNIKLGHMACIVEDDDKHPALESITFLYKFIGGACPKSYGFNVAHIAGIREEIVQKGYQKAQELERATKQEKLFRQLVSCRDDELIEMLKEIQLQA